MCRPKAQTGGLPLRLAWSSAESDITTSAAWADVDGDGDPDLLPNGLQFAAWWELVDGTDKVEWIRHDLPPGDLTYYRVNFQSQWFYTPERLSWLTLMLNGEVGYADGLRGSNRFIPLEWYPSQAEAVGLTVPLEALTHGSGGSGVYVVEDSRARHRPIRLGVIGATRARVMAGVSEGESVVVAPNTVRNGDRVATAGGG